MEIIMNNLKTTILSVHFKVQTFSSLNLMNSFVNR